MVYQASSLDPSCAHRGPGTHCACSITLTILGVWILTYITPLICSCPVFMNLNFQLYVCTCALKSTKYIAEAGQGFLKMQHSLLLCSRLIFQYIIPSMCWINLPKVLLNFTDILTHVQMMCTRPFLLLKGPGDEAMVHLTLTLFSPRLLRKCQVSVRALCT